MMENTLGEPQIKSDILEKLPRVVQESPWLLYGKADGQQKTFPLRLDVSQSQKDAISQGTVLLESDGIQIIHPENPLVEEDSEGLHLRIEAKDIPAHPKTPQEWKRWIKAWEIAMGAGKIITEAQTSNDVWVSFSGEHDFSPSDHIAIEIFGRRPESPSWGRTIPMPTEADFDHRVHRFPDSNLVGLQKTLRRYFGEHWLPLIEHVGVSPFPFDVVDPNSPDFANVNKRDPEQPFFWKNELLYLTPEYKVSGCVAAHVRSGVHLMVEYNKDHVPIRPWDWERLSDGMEGLVMSEMMGQTLSETPYQGTPLIERWKNSLTGSWYGKFYGLPEKMEAEVKAAQLAGVALGKKAFAHRFRGVPVGKYDSKYKQGPDQWSTKAHWHMYGAREGESMVQFGISIDKGEDEWNELQGLGMEKMGFIREILNKELPARIASAFPKESSQ